MGFFVSPSRRKDEDYRTFGKDSILRPLNRGRQDYNMEWSSRFQ